MTAKRCMSKYRIYNSVLLKYGKEKNMEKNEIIKNEKLWNPKCASE